MKTRIFATLAVVAVLAIGVSAPAIAAEAYTGSLSANSAAPGGTLQYTADKTGELAGTTGSYSLSSSQSGALGAPVVHLAADVTHAIRVGSHTQLAFTVKIPTTAKIGSAYTLTVNAGTFSDTKTINVVGVAAPSASTSNLTWLWIVLAVALLIILALIFFIVRRRRNAASGAAAA